MKPVEIAAGLKVVIANLETAAIEYMVVGSVAGTIYGEPRLTNDLDLVVSMTGSSPKALLSAFNDDDFYLPPQEIITQEIAHSGQINLIHYPSGIKVDLMFRKVSQHALSEFARRQRIEILRGLLAWVAAPEDIIIAKLRFYREGGSQKHLVDIRGILANTQVDRDYLERWIDELHLREIFANV